MTKLDKIKFLFLKFRGLTEIGVANIVTAGISALFWLYIARLLGTENYGIVSYLIAISALTTVLSFIGAGTTLQVYTAKEVKLQPALYFITLVIATISSIALFFIVHNIGVSLFVLGNVIFGLVIADLLGRKQYKKFSIYLITQKILTVVFALALFHIINYNGIILGFALSFFPYAVSMYRIFKGAKIDFSLLKSRFGFIVNSYIMDLGRQFSSSLDKLIVAPMLGFALLGNYQLGVQILTVLCLLPSIVYQYTLSHDASGDSNKKLKQLVILGSVILTILGITLAPIIIPVLFPKFTEAVIVIQIMSLSTIPITINNTYISKFLGTEKIKIVLIGSGIFLAIQISMIILLGKIFGINGVAASFVLATTSESSYLIIIAHYFKKKNIKN